MCLDLLAPHVELVAAHGDSESLCLFADAQGQILTLDPQAETMFQSMPAFAARLRTVLPGWIRECSSKPLKPFRVDIQDRGLIYHFRISPAGTGRSPLFRVSWTSSKPEPPLPASVLGAFALQYRLSPRERDVLACAVTGKQMKEMAQQLGLAVDTVKEYLGSLYHKVGVDGRGPLVAKILSQVAFAPLTTLPSPLDNTELL
ncbi:MAG: helix-turn-helix transcriptional regulator [Nitrospirae bacterium]|nr:helix-turn-helix transcriptional regulator [Nitrospirota bacterium]